MRCLTLVTLDDAASLEFVTGATAISLRCELSWFVAAPYILTFVLPCVTHQQK
jgi:hypothetical protein